MHHHAGRIQHTTAFVTPVVEHWLEREIAQCVAQMKGGWPAEMMWITCREGLGVVDDMLGGRGWDGVVGWMICREGWYLGG